MHGISMRGTGRQLMTEVKESVRQALDEIKCLFSGHAIDVVPDEQGGVFVRVHELEIGDQYLPNVTWIGFRITFQCPFPDVYPHFTDPSIQRKDGKPLRDGFSRQKWQFGKDHLQVTQISRRSKKHNPQENTPGVKLGKVLDWIRKQ